MSAEQDFSYEHQRSAAIFIAEASPFMSVHYPYVVFQIENSTTHHMGTGLGLLVLVKDNVSMPDIIKQRITSTFSRRLRDQFQQTDAEARFYADTRDELINASKDLDNLGHQCGNSSISESGDIIIVKELEPEFQEVFHGKFFYKYTIYRFK
ncbi:hypothetical protein HY085_00205 [Candidatus Gottesmanbacteria bacterium]|nr:hypothetical protein [Candidatus Gottesmanbacteria bacterium]